MANYSTISEELKTLKDENEGSRRIIADKDLRLSQMQLRLDVIIYIYVDYLIYLFIYIINDSQLTQSTCLRCKKRKIYYSKNVIEVSI